MLTDLVDHSRRNEHSLLHDECSGPRNYCGMSLPFKSLRRLKKLLRGLRANRFADHSCWNEYRDSACLYNHRGWRYSSK